MTNWPRLWDLEHSDCQVGTVDVLRPLPKLAYIVSLYPLGQDPHFYPVTSLPTMN